MKNFLSKIKLFYTEFVRKKETYKRHGIKPNHDWLLILIVSFIAFCFLAGFSFYVYIQVKNDKLFSANKAIMTNDAKINMDLLKKIVDDFNSRKEATDSIRTNRAKVSDPSL